MIGIMIVVCMTIALFVLAMVVIDIIENDQWN